MVRRAILNPEGGRPADRAATLRAMLPVGVSVVLLSHILYRLDWRVLLSRAAEIEGVYLAASFLVLLPLQAVNAWRLRRLMLPTVLDIPLTRLFRICFIAQFYAMFLPSGVGQSAGRWVKVTRNQRGRSQFAVVLLVEKSLFVAVTLIFVALPLALAPDARTDHLRATFLFLLAVGLFALAIFYGLLLRGHVQKWISMLGRRLVDLVGGERQAATAQAELGRAYAASPSLLFSALVATTAIQVLVILRIGLLIFSVGIPLDWISVAWMSSLVFAIQTLPISWAGVGVRESAFAYVLGLFGMASEAAILVSLLFFMQLIASAVVGWAFELADRQTPP